jgi:hypothetical protein
MDPHSAPIVRRLPAAWAALSLSTASPTASARPIVERERVAVLLDLWRSQALMRSPPA